MIVEVSTFRLRPDGNEAEFVTRDARMQTEFAYLQPGLLRRTLARGDDGGWVVVTLWGSVANAERAAEHAGSDPAAVSFWDLVDPASLDTVRYETVD